VSANKTATFSAGLLALLLAAKAAPGQPPGPTANPCVLPAPRTDARATERLREINQRVRENAGRAKVIFVGDSITQGWESNGRQVWAKYYAPRHALNLGIGSDHTQHVLWRLEHGNLEGLHPQVAVVLIGVNNAPDEANTPGMIAEGVAAVVRKLRQKLPRTRVLLLGIFPFREQFDMQRAKVLQVNQLLRKLDDGRWIHFLDFGHRLVQPDGRICREMMPDFVHLTPAGYRIWAEEMEPKLAALLGQRPRRP